MKGAAHRLERLVRLEHRMQTSTTRFVSADAWLAYECDQRADSLALTAASRTTRTSVLLSLALTKVWLKRNSFPGKWNRANFMWYKLGGVVRSSQAMMASLVSDSSPMLRVAATSWIERVRSSDLYAMSSWLRLGHSCTHEASSELSDTSACRFHWGGIKYK